MGLGDAMVPNVIHLAIIVRRWVGTRNEERGARFPIYSLLAPRSSFLHPPMDNEIRKKWLPFAVLAAALVVWAGWFALGAYLEPSADQPHRDIRKPLIVMACMAAFLAFWGIALWRRSRRL
jgi:hypothetical protein